METKLIRCCKCKDHEWSTSEDIIYTDEQNNEYCLFHAPVGEKKCGKKDYMPIKLFNNVVFEYINDRHSASNNATCNISGTVFPGDIDFAALFSKSKRLEAISLQHSVFSGKANFRGLTISNLSLSEATFFKEANFNDVVFEDIPVLDHLTFRSRAYFNRSEFKKGCCFDGSAFDDAAWFEACIFSGQMLFHSIKAKKNALRMHKLTKASLSFLCFPSLEAQQFSFKECPYWPSNFGLESEKLTSKLTLEELYRALKQKAVEEHDQPQVSHWHFREKQMVKERGGDSFFEAIMLWFYWATSGFGEKPFRAGMCLFILIVAAYIFNCIQQPDWITNLPGSPAANATMAFIPFTKDIPGEGWVKVGRGFWQLLIAVQFTLFALAVRNRFRR